VPGKALLLSDRYGPKATLSVWLWLFTSLIGSTVAALALREVVLNWRALVRAKSPYTELLASILSTNLYQQVGRLVMEGLCLTAGIVAVVAPVQVRPHNLATTAVSWLLVCFRCMLVANNTVEYISQRRQRRRLTQQGAAH
jgi:hypothetical protein